MQVAHDDDDGPGDHHNHHHHHHHPEEEDNDNNDGGGGRANMRMVMTGCQVPKQLTVYEAGLDVITTLTLAINNHKSSCLVYDFSNSSY